MRRAAVHNPNDSRFPSAIKFTYLPKPACDRLDKAEIVKEHPRRLREKLARLVVIVFLSLSLVPRRQKPAILYRDPEEARMYALTLVVLRSALPHQPPVLHMRPTHLLVHGRRQ
jgi:hypothetical protein